MPISYPRTCDQCHKTYKTSPSFFRHLRTEKCARSVEANRKIAQVINVETVNVVTNDQSETEEQLAEMKSTLERQKLREFENRIELEKQLEKVQQRECKQKLELEKQIEEMRLELENYKVRQGEPKRELTEIIYILQTRHSFAAGLNVYKVGRTKDMRSRKNGYPKGSHVISQFACINAIVLETKILNKLRETFQERKDFGSEYFECPLHHLHPHNTRCYRTFFCK